MQWSKTELEALWATVNPGNGNPHTMAAIAEAESGGNDQIVNSIGACGLWQIHPRQPGCQNPYTNARQAGEKLRSQGLGAWESYTNGSYRQYLTGAAGGRINTSLIPGVELFPGEGFVQEAIEGNVPNPIKPLEQGVRAVEKGFEALGLLEKVFKLISTREGWIRIGKVGVGLFLLLTGVLGMAKVETSAPAPAKAVRGELSSRATEAAIAAIPK